MSEPTYHEQVCKLIGIRTLGDMPTLIYTQDSEDKGESPETCAQYWIEDWAAELSER